ncbi:hypothetical protein TWF217_008313 [Orbilia oligospora]|nr:hypothetical protein TWF217_008313 [Orbilia oligospora]KAF3270430.1 hypothetical protein TWF128_004205 [Orbilia oligospora]KAF3298082.1 hypothetical protein TWF132_004220 [Orbilia oligospora]
MSSILPSWPWRSNQYHDISRHPGDPENLEEKMEQRPHKWQARWKEMFFDVCLGFFFNVFTSRSKFSILGFIVGISLGYTVSTGASYDQIHSISLNKPISPEQSGTKWGKDLYFYPPLDEERYPAVPSYNILSETSDILASARNMTSQSPVTPLFVPFTRNFVMLRQTILSYIAAGWPRDQIYIIDNSGTMDANYNGLLSVTNPFYLNYKLFRGRYGVNIVRTPTLLNFAQLQNYMLATAINQNWTHFYWTHQDVVVLSDELSTPYHSLYERVLTSLVSLIPTMNSKSTLQGGSRWSIVWYDFDWLTLVNVGVASSPKNGVGSWDTFVPYYATDCDYYERLRLSGYPILERKVGDIFDLSKPVPNAESAFFRKARNNTEEDSGRLCGSSQYTELKNKLKLMMKEKGASGRNTWQDAQKGGKGEPWTYDPSGFQTAWWDMAAAGSSNGKTLGGIWGGKETPRDEINSGMRELYMEEEKELWELEPLENLESDGELGATGRSGAAGRSGATRRASFRCL